jgi:taurine dioxygenase
MYQPTYRINPATTHAPQREPGRYRRISVHPASGALGADVTGVDLRALDDETFRELERALADHLVLFIRDQQLRPDDQKAFGRRFGPLHCWPYAKPLAGHPEITELRSEPDDVFNFGGSWHSDSMHYERPPMLTMLYCLECPAVGGDTSYSNQYLAWDALSPGLRRTLARRRAVNSSAQYLAGHFGSAEVSGRTSTPLRYGTDEDQEVLHPVARTHPVTGRQALFVCDSFTVRFEGMSQAESLPWLRYLWRHAIQPEFTCRFRWRPGTLAVWDNRCVQHYAHNDYPGSCRVMHRSVIEGDRPR